MKIINAELISENRRERITGGVYITYISKENISKGTFLKLIYKDKNHYFEVTNISIDGPNLKVKCKEVGYRTITFEQDSDFDLRELIGIELEKITDEKLISRIHEMSCWC